MKYMTGWSSHLPILIKVLMITDGPVLELGSGLFSTPVMYWLCKSQNREFVSYENYKEYFELVKNFNKRKQKVLLIKNWDEAKIEGTHWSLALVDHAPARRRRTEVKRLAHTANFVVVHDTEPESDKWYKYAGPFALYKYRYDWTKAKPYTSVLSNFIDLSFLNG